MDMCLYFGFLVHLFKNSHVPQTTGHYIMIKQITPRSEHLPLPAAPGPFPMTLQLCDKNSNYDPSPWYPREVYRCSICIAWRVLETQNLRPYPRPPEAKILIRFQGSQKRIKLWEVLIYLLA